MARLIDVCEAAQPHRDWAKLRALPYADLSPLAAWIQRPFLNDPPAEPLRGLWFGLFNPYTSDDEPSADIYVCGSQRFDPNPDSYDWAVDPYWWPEDRYARSTVLAEIYRIAYRKKGLENDAEYPLCLGYGAFAVRELLGMIDPKLLLGKSDELGIAVGFDSGDFILLGRLTAAGLDNCYMTQ